MELAQLVASEDEFTGIDGNNYRLAPLGLKEIGEFCIWIQFRDYEIGKRIGLPKDELTEVYKQCKETAIKFEQKEFLAAILTAEGLHRLIWYSMKLANPEIQESHVSKVISTANINEISDKVFKCSGLLGSNEESVGEQMPQ